MCERVWSAPRCFTVRVLRANVWSGPLPGVPYTCSVHAVALSSHRALAEDWMARFKSLVDGFKEVPVRIQYGVPLSRDEVASLERDFDVSVNAPPAHEAGVDCVCALAGQGAAVDDVFAFLQRRCAGNQPTTAAVEVEDLAGAPSAVTVAKCECCLRMACGIARACARVCWGGGREASRLGCEE